jgi:hypothetical protein
MVGLVGLVRLVGRVGLALAPNPKKAGSAKEQEHGKPDPQMEVAKLNEGIAVAQNDKRGEQEPGYKDGHACFGGEASKQVGWRPRN